MSLTLFLSLSFVKRFSAIIIKLPSGASGMTNLQEQISPHPAKPFETFVFLGHMRREFALQGLLRLHQLCVCSLILCMMTIAIFV
eukprot:TRINITY_DN7764_c0_g1_i1.p2 TRINITY_DN7764_c0_g1~~TRINITY_DN7764_c0_g1_i1.p2  ORF type:complete len:85 (-),score=8.71 TRINITY_DN7764_c0_g1_i1:807-1061(-)